MADIEKIEVSLKNVASILKAADGVIKNPKNTLASELQKNNNGSLLANGLISGGVMGIVATSGVAGIGSGLTALIGGMGAAATAATVSGPVGWGIVGTAVLLLYKKWKRAQQAQQEKERLKNETIRKQQAIINELKRKNARNEEEIRNLKQTLEVLEEILRKMNKAA